MVHTAGGGSTGPVLPLLLLRYRTVVQLFLSILLFTSEIWVFSAFNFTESCTVRGTAIFCT
jgi:hypothetical protein